MRGGDSMLKLCRTCKYDWDGHCVEGNDYWRSFKAKEDDECEDYERRDEDAQTQEAENADAGNIK